jgi:hypothetical protein
VLDREQFAKCEVGDNKVVASSISSNESHGFSFDCSLVIS